MKKQYSLTAWVRLGIDFVTITSIMIFISNNQTKDNLLANLWQIWCIAYAGLNLAVIPGTKNILEICTLVWESIKEIGKVRK
jgi:hypothetical protein